MLSPRKSEKRSLYAQLADSNPNPTSGKPNAPWGALLAKLDEIEWVNNPISARIQVLSYLFPQEAIKLANSVNDIMESINARLLIDRSHLERRGIKPEVTTAKKRLDADCYKPHAYYESHKLKLETLKDDQLTLHDPFFTDYKLWLSKFRSPGLQSQRDCANFERTVFHQIEKAKR